MLQRHYAFYAIFEPSESGGYGVRFPDLPELFSGGDDEIDAEKTTKEGLAFCLRELDAEGAEIPAPSDPRTFELAPGETARKIEVDMADYYPGLFASRQGRGGARPNSGRRKLKPGEQRSGRQAGRKLVVRLTDDEFERLVRLSSDANKSKSEYVRDVVFAGRS